MRLVDGLFNYGENVAIDVDGKLIKRKVHYADGELFVDIDGKRIKQDDLSGIKKFDKSVYNTEYNRNCRARFTATIPKEQGDRWTAMAKERGMSMNAFIIHCVEKEING